MHQRHHPHTFGWIEALLVIAISLVLIGLIPSPVRVTFRENTQRGCLIIRVVDADTNQPIPGAYIRLLGPFYDFTGDMRFPTGRLGKMTFDETWSSRDRHVVIPGLYWFDMTMSVNVPKKVVRGEAQGYVASFPINVADYSNEARHDGDSYTLTVTLKLHRATLPAIP